MRKIHFILIGMLLFCFIASNLFAPISAGGPHGTRNPDAGVEVTPPANLTGEPAEVISYEFTLKNVGDQNDTFTITASSSNSWSIDLSSIALGPLGVNETTSVFANITIPVGEPENTVDNLTLTATSVIDGDFFDEATVSTTVEEGFLVDISIEGGYNWTSGVESDLGVNYTLVLKNKGNVDVDITLGYIEDSTDSWNVTFHPFFNLIVPVDKATGGIEGIQTVNITVKAPLGAQPNESLNLTLWGEKTDVPPFWYSYQHQENITITTIVEPRLGIKFYPEPVIGYISIKDTIFNLTLENTGNKDMIYELVIDRDPILNTVLDYSLVTLRVGEMIVAIHLAVNTSIQTPQGNYTINISALDNTTKNLIGGVELYYIIVPELNITNVTISDKEPTQNKETDVYVTIENTGYVDATNLTINLYEGTKSAAQAHLDFLNASETARVKIKWSPSDFGNQTIRIAIDVDGSGNFTNHGTGIAQDFLNVKVKVDWQPYYLAIYIIIVIILGIAVFSSMVTLKYYGGVRHLNDYGETPEEGEYEDYPEDEGTIQEREKLEGDRSFGTYATESKMEAPVREPSRPPRDHDERPVDYPPKREKVPEDTPPAPAKDPETLRKEDEMRHEISRVKDKLDKTKSLGVDTTNIDQLLRTANRNLSEGNHHKAKQYLGYATERIDTLMAKRNEAQRAIKEAKEVLSGMKGTADLTIVENFLVKADSLFEEGDYREAINYANKAKERAVRLQRREMRL